MGYADEIKKVYIPIHKDNHWYLLIVDHKNEDRIYLDSCKCMKERAGRVEALNFAAYKLHNMLKDPKFYEKEESLPPSLLVTTTSGSPMLRNSAISRETADYMLWNG
ncbi:hypothetical protein PIB30_006645 [Stylosanthes scabra]|uniref:Ubiquitin-like protease family profile domain-containing protein n=1 Tax=Stylosanthes scabra TaxID=79078 RepID=A0ABU6Q4G8_9FABA|nr:hypothetical protein [Stylosanthes scabra]